MENLLDESKYQLIRSIALKHTTYLRNVNYVIERNEKASYHFLKMFITDSDKSPLERLIHIHNQVWRIFSATTSYASNNYYLQAMLLVWGEMYVIAYFHYHDDPDWKELFLPKMLSMTAQKAVENDMQKATKFIDEYLAENQRWEEKLAAKQDPLPFCIQNSPYTIAENQKANVIKVLNYMFDLNLFADKDGKPLSRKKSQFMVDMGKCLNSDFENYAQIVNKAAQEDHFDDIFLDMLEKAKGKVLS